MPSGQIAKNKTKTTIVIEKDLKKTLEKIAKDQNRSFNNLVITVLTDYVKNQ